MKHVLILALLALSACAPKNGATQSLSKAVDATPDFVAPVPLVDATPSPVSSPTPSPTPTATPTPIAFTCYGGSEVNCLQDGTFYRLNLVAMFAPLIPLNGVVHAYESTVCIESTVQSPSTNAYGQRTVCGATLDTINLVLEP